MPKTWPASGSEYLLNDMQISLSQEHLRECPDPQHCLHRFSLTYHDLVRDVNEVHLKLLHDRYATAAGFRD